MRWLTNILGLTLTGALLSVGVAAAASLVFTTGTLAAGNATVGGCTSASLTASRNVDNSGQVTQVKVLSVPHACSGETLSVTLANARVGLPPRSHALRTHLH